MREIITGPLPSSAPGTGQTPPATLVIFGANGDLTSRLLFPSLYNLACAGLLDDGFRILGLDIAGGSTEAWRTKLGDVMRSFTTDRAAEFHPAKIDDERWDWLMQRAELVQADFSQDETFAALKERVGDDSAIFYLAVPSRFFGGIIDHLGRSGLLQEPDDKFRRLIIEKPFGSDLASSKTLNRRILRRAREDQVFRIDHFMGKEPVQSILAMRFANGLFEPLWRSEYIDRVEITAAETIGVEGRGRFYEPTGVLRDMVPNHLFQLLCMVAMDPPSSLDAEAIRSEKTRLLEAVRPLQPSDMVFGQYGAGTINGKPVPAYREEPDVAPDSVTATYVAARLQVDSWRWAGTPFYLRTGKRLAARRTEIALYLKPAPFALFPEAPRGAATSDMIVLSIGPQQGIEIVFDVKRPGPTMDIAKAATRFDFQESFEERPNVGYEVLLYDCMRGDTTLFQRADTIEASWRIVDPVLRNGQSSPPEIYAAGTPGPACAGDVCLTGWRDLRAGA
ncbi:glucose-6-phosphate dehydrogenase [Consotaella aegiceratis]|uniref:glucose-6-phosphate dehydrogenase n=1 Tax=Consotaella aegiceratis TaxID=3097961 RepID=UPI002F429B31